MRYQSISDMDEELLKREYDLDEDNGCTCNFLRHNCRDQCLNKFPWRRLLKSILTLSILMMLFFGMALIILLTPNQPTVEFKSMEVSNFTISFSLPSPYSNWNMSATWKTKFLVRNPNRRLQISYSEIVTAVYYKKERLWSAEVESFCLEKESEKTVVSTVEMRAPTAIEEKAAFEMEVDRFKAGAVEFNVEIGGKVWFKPGSKWMWGKQSVMAKCENVQARVLVEKDGSISLVEDGSRNCRVIFSLYKS
ncbi:uncharacterized protein LOC110820750 [Carica papaya]|uniref:uncharacterized protein LOC110820750 n=1 Tax=Carica papaya TaxID=3649 RepID=UPI000B8CD2F8|nr:uncharacterized protein LOC110820750 [Carica papaya]